MNHYNEKMAEKNTIKCSSHLWCCALHSQQSIGGFIKGIKERVTIYIVKTDKLGESVFCSISAVLIAVPCLHDYNIMGL